MDYQQQSKHYIKGIIIKPLTLIINQMLDPVVFPANLKIAQLIPMFKKDGITLFNNDRPISQLPIIYKVGRTCYV